MGNNSKVNSTTPQNSNQHFAQHFVAAMMILVASVTRLAPHWPNFTSVGSLALFAGAVYGFRVQSLLIPFATMLLTDYILGFHSQLIAVYAAFGLQLFYGAFFLRNLNMKNFTGVVLLGSLSFFLITNFSVWLLSGMYTKDFSGLMASYTMGLPFLLNQVLGDFFYSGLLIGCYHLIFSKQDQKLRV